MNRRSLLRALFALPALPAAALAAPLAAAVPCTRLKFPFTEIRFPDRVSTFTVPHGVTLVEVTKVGGGGGGGGYGERLLHPAIPVEVTQEVMRFRIGDARCCR
jgi:hypothetical protein